jgi:hypothetical protein
MIWAFLLFVLLCFLGLAVIWKPSKKLSMPSLPSMAPSPKSSSDLDDDLSLIAEALHRAEQDKKRDEAVLRMLERFETLKK